MNNSTVSTFSQEQAVLNKNLPVIYKPVILTRDDLSFTQRDEAGRMINWRVENMHSGRNSWEREYDRGEAFFNEVIELSKVDKEAAREAVKYAVDSQYWQYRENTNSYGWSAEEGFANALAQHLFECY